MNIQDPIERLEARQEMLIEAFVNINTCMECGKEYDYEMYCVSPLGDGPCVCVECLGFDPGDHLNSANEE